MKVQTKVDVTVQRPTAQTFSKEVRVTFSLTMTDVQRGGPVIGTVEKAFKGAQDLAVRSIDRS